MADEFRADYDELEAIARKFADLGERARRVKEQMQQQYDQLIGDQNWIGRGSDAFAREMDGEIFPALERMIRALEETSEATNRISSIAQDAEDDASARFNRR